MAPKIKIKPGQVSDIFAAMKNRDLLKDWAFVDVGFSGNNASCGIAIGESGGGKKPLVLVSVRG